MGARLNVHFQSKKSDWETPPEIFGPLDEEFRFTLDVCATKRNAKCIKFFTRKLNGLSLTWAGERCWMNPPYGREIGAWIEKAVIQTRLNHALVVALLPARTDTKWWHQYIWNRFTNTWQRNVECRFIQGRIKFVGAPHPAPFPSCVVIFGGKKR